MTDFLSQGCHGLEGSGGQTGTPNRLFASSTMTGWLFHLGHAMAKHKLSRAEQARGLRTALRSSKTPPWLKPAIKRYLRKLEPSRRV